MTAPALRLLDLLASSTYRVTTFVALALLGTLLVDARRSSSLACWAHSWGLGLIALSAGAAVALGQKAGLWDAKDYDPGLASVWTTAALALLVVAVADLLAEHARPLARVLAATGRATLTLYVLHTLGQWAWLRFVDPTQPMRAPVLWAVTSVLVLALPQLWARTTRGPVEAVVDRLVRAVA